MTARTASRQKRKTPTLIHGTRLGFKRVYLLGNNAVAASGACLGGTNVGSFSIWDGWDIPKRIRSPNPTNIRTYVSNEIKDGSWQVR